MDPLDALFVELLSRYQGAEFTLVLELCGQPQWDAAMRPVLARMERYRAEYRELTGRELPPLQRDSYKLQVRSDPGEDD